jgi:hypothetical protein
MSRPDPIQYAERLYAAIRAANFSPISFLAFGSAVKDGVDLRRMPRIAAEPFMRVVGEMLDLESTMREELIDADEISVAENDDARSADSTTAERTNHVTGPAAGALAGTLPESPDGK